MAEFLRKFENRSIQIARVNSILITKSILLLLFIRCWGVIEGDFPCIVYL